MVTDEYIPNAAREGNSLPQNGVGLFTVSTPRVATVRLLVLIIVPVLLGVLAFVATYLKYCTPGGGKWLEDMRFAEGAYQFWRAEVLQIEAQKLGDAIETWEEMGRLKSKTRDTAWITERDRRKPSVKKVSKVVKSCFDGCPKEVN